MAIKSTSPLEGLRTFARFMDSSIQIPGTRIRFGLDFILGLIPGGGDILTGFISSYTLWVGLKMGVSGWTLLRMLFNIALDVMLGLIPLAGDIVDIFWKSNTKNLELIEQSVQDAKSTEKRSKFVLISIVIGLILWNVALFILFIWLLTSLASLL